MDKERNLKSLLFKLRELREGRMDDHPGVKFHKDRAIATGDASPFFRYLEKNPNYIRLDIQFSTEYPLEASSVK